MKVVEPCKLRLVEQIGEGQFAKVFKGTLDGQDVAVKCANASPTAKAALRREVDVLSTCAHTNIVRVEGVTEDDRCMVLELCSGTVEDLLSSVRLKRSKSRGKSKRQAMPVRRIVQISLEMMRGIEYLHGKGLCHGDLKPANILMSGKVVSAKTPRVRHRVVSDSEAGVRLNDFGFSRRIGDRVSCEDGGSRPFIPRELQLELESTVLANQDVYASGVVLLDLVCTQKPYEDLSNAEFEEALEEGTLYSRGSVPLAQFRNSAAADALVDLVFEMVSVDPRARPTAAEAVVRLEAIAAALDASREAARAGRGASSPASGTSSSAFSPAASAMLVEVAEDEPLSSPLGICSALALPSAPATASGWSDASSHHCSNVRLWQDEEAPAPHCHHDAVSEADPAQQSPALGPMPSVASGGADGVRRPGRTAAGSTEGVGHRVAEASGLHTAPAPTPPMTLASLSASPVLVEVPDCPGEAPGCSWASLRSTLSGALLPGSYAGCCALWRSWSGPGRQPSDGTGGAHSGPGDMRSHIGVSDALAVTPRREGGSDDLTSPGKQWAADSKRCTW